jgi:hypothetical protein
MSPTAPPSFTAIPCQQVHLTRPISATSINPTRRLPYSKKAFKQRIREAQWAGALELNLIPPTAAQMDSKFQSDLHYLGHHTFQNYLETLSSIVWDLGGSPLFPVLVINELSSTILQNWKGHKPVARIRVRLPASAPDLAQCRTAYESGWPVIIELVPVAQISTACLLDSAREILQSAPPPIRPVAFAMPSDEPNSGHLPLCIDDAPQIAYEWHGDPSKFIKYLHDGYTQWGSVDVRSYHAVKSGQIAQPFVRNPDLPVPSRLAQQGKRLALWIRDRGTIAPVSRCLAD